MCYGFPLRLHFLKVIEEVESILTAPYLVFTPGWMVTWVGVGGGVMLQVVSEHGCALLGKFVDLAFMSFAYVFLMLMFYVLVTYAWFCS